MQLDGLTINGARNSRSVHLISVLSFLGHHYEDGSAQIIMGQVQPLAGWCWVFSVVHAQMEPCSYIELRVWRCRTNRRTYYSDMPRTSGTYRNTWTDGFDFEIVDDSTIQQHCCLAAVFDVDVDPFQKKKKKEED